MLSYVGNLLKVNNMEVTKDEILIHQIEWVHSYFQLKVQLVREIVHIYGYSVIIGHVEIVKWLNQSN
jgi:hypothetical protein